MIRVWRKDGGDEGWKEEGRGGKRRERGEEKGEGEGHWLCPLFIHTNKIEKEEG